MNQGTKIVFINGPKGVGKDTLGLKLKEHYNPLWVQTGTFLPACIKMARPIKDMLRTMFSLSPEEYAFFIEGTGKDVACERFFGYSPRHLMIDFSEQWAKRLFGPEVFGKLMVQNQSLINRLCFITDTGFGPETKPITIRFGSQHCALIRLHRLGLNYSGDSRDTVEIPGVISTDISTDTTIEESFNAAIKFIDDFLSTSGTQGL